jgi:hypothetical protein
VNGLLYRTHSNAAQAWRDVLPTHAAAELFPLMTDEQSRELEENIKRHGQQIPVFIQYGIEDGVARLLDGRNRLDAMERAGLLHAVVEDDEPELLGVNVEYVLSEIDPYDFVLSVNLHRRHLSPEQKRDLIAKVIKAKPEQSNRQVAKQVKADHKTVGKVRKEMEGRGDVPHVETRTDTKGRKQPAKRKSAVGATKPFKRCVQDAGHLSPAEAHRLPQQVIDAATAVAEQEAHSKPVRKPKVVREADRFEAGLASICSSREVLDEFKVPRLTDQQNTDAECRLLDFISALQELLERIRAERAARERTP